MPKDVPSARLLVWSVMQMMPSSPDGVPLLFRSGQQNHTCLTSGKLSRSLAEGVDLLIESCRSAWQRAAMGLGFRTR